MARYRKFRIPEFEASRESHVRQASVEERTMLMDRAERLLVELDPDQEYSVRGLFEHIDVAPESGRKADKQVSGADAVHDLRLLVEDVSDSLDLRPEDLQDRVLTTDEVARRFNVSTKTVGRWRDRGLASRRFTIDGRKRVGFLESSVERFARRHPDEVRRGSQFQQLDETERQRLLDRARELAADGENLSGVARQVGAELGRAPETVRYTIRQHDEKHPRQAVFSTRRRALGEREHAELLRRFRRGDDYQTLAEDFGASVSTVRRTLDRLRADELREADVDYMPSDEFERPDADEFILTAAPEAKRKKAAPKPPKDLPAYLQSLYLVPLLTKEQEVHHFRKMNYLKFKAARLLESMDLDRPKTKELDRVEELLRQAHQVRNLLVRSNLRLVVSAVKKYAQPGANFFELVSDGNVSLMRAIDKFDYTRGFKLSTYATWAIRKNLSRSIPKEFKQLDRFRTGQDEYLQDSGHAGTSQYEQEYTNAAQRSALEVALDHLPDRERQIVVSRFGLGGDEPQRLQDIGDTLGVSKERIRQLERRALERLREVVDEENLDIPGVR